MRSFFYRLYIGGPPPRPPSLGGPLGLSRMGGSLTIPLGGPSLVPRPLESMSSGLARFIGGPPRGES